MTWPLKPVVPYGFFPETTSSGVIRARPGGTRKPSTTHRLLAGLSFPFASSTVGPVRFGGPPRISGVNLRESYSRDHRLRNVSNISAQTSALCFCPAYSPSHDGRLDEKNLAE